MSINTASANKLPGQWLMKEPVKEVQTTQGVVNIGTLEKKVLGKYSSETLQIILLP
jgi:hypothetical protein